MAKRPRKLPRKKSKKLFTRTAKKIHPKNMGFGPMRGGIRA